MFAFDTGVSAEKQLSLEIFAKIIWKNLFFNKRMDVEALNQRGSSLTLKDQSLRVSSTGTSALAVRCWTQWPRKLYQPAWYLGESIFWMKKPHMLCLCVDRK